MAKVTKTQVVDALQAEDYEKACKLGTGALPHLKTIVGQDDVSLAAKAAYLAGMINEDASVPVIQKAAASRKPVLRVAAANAAGQLSPERAEPLLKKLLQSRDAGIRKHAIRAAGSACCSTLRPQLERIKKGDSEKGLRTLATESLKNLK